MLSQYFKGYLTNNNTQKMVEDLVIAAIQQYGFDVHYIPRELGNMNHVYGEDTLSHFDHAPVVEVYVKNTDHLGGEGLMMSKFGIEKRDSITLQMARRRFTEIRTAKIMAENSSTPQNEDAITDQPLISDAFELEDGNTGGFEIEFERPRPGDLVYFPMDKKLYEIKFVEDRVDFYQFGKLQLYELECDLFEYSHERINTGVAEIDVFNNFSGDSLGYQFEGAEEPGIILGEDGALISEDYEIENSDKQANNNLFSEKTQGMVDWSEVNPMVKLNVKRRW